MDYVKDRGFADSKTLTEAKREDLQKAIKASVASHRHPILLLCVLSDPVAQLHRPRTLIYASVCFANFFCRLTTAWGG